jgi:putative transposase
MSESYKIKDDGLYFVTFGVVGWLDIFTRRIYQDILIESFQYCQANKNLELYCYCFMPNHIHMIAGSENGSLTGILKSLKSFTAKEMMKAISENPLESRKELFLHQFNYFGKKSKNAEMQFWKHANHPIYLFSNEMINQKVDYIHQNPVEAGFVNEAHEWRLSSANPNGPLKTKEF